MNIAFLVVLLIIAIIPMADAVREKKQPKDGNAATTQKSPSKGYLQSIAYLWSGVLAVFVMCLIGGISTKDVGLRPFDFPYNTWITVITLVLWGLACAFFLYQTILPVVSPKQREAAKEHLTNDKREGAVNALPRTDKERWLFSLLAFSAGTCEEILFRGFMVFLLSAVFPGIPTYLLFLIPVVLFGICHLYQGVQGVVTTGVFGAVAMWLFLASGSLIPGIALHFVSDLSSVFLRLEDQPSNSAA